MSTPARLPFARSERSTVGLEWELALVDTDSGDLRQTAGTVLEALAPDGDHPRFKSEFLRNTVEVVSGVSRTVGEAGADLQRSVEEIRRITDPQRVELMCAGTHPFASWEAQKVTDKDRYTRIIDRTQFWGRQLLIYGLHVHVGVEDRAKALPLLAGLLPYVPHLQALSASSPYWGGVDTGYASTRTLLFQQIPTAGLPYQFDSWEELEAYAGDMLHVGVVDQFNEIHWDIRPSPTYGTLEVRVCDGPTNLAELLALAALVHCLVEHLSTQLDHGRTLPTMPHWFVRENKWRAARYGMEAIVITDADGEEELVTDSVGKLLVELEPVAERLGCSAELAGVRDILRSGASYQRQRAMAARHDGDLEAVVHGLVAEMRAGRPLG
ncbi:glutamate--cysteine ligase [Antribacter gilvus]|uniref:glutamate--cysteine ligase n=1 Tax=Antribacter gilvus TaxID=2304675 RepID=UPI000F766933|nr:glutamate--cysteine ligase [Antribacter gilvus]